MKPSLFQSLIDSLVMQTSTYKDMQARLIEAEEAMNSMINVVAELQATLNEVVSSNEHRDAIVSEMISGTDVMADIDTLLGPPGKPDRGLN